MVAIRLIVLVCVGGATLSACAPKHDVRPAASEPTSVAAPAPAQPSPEAARKFKAAPVESAAAVSGTHLPKGRMPDPDLTPGKASYRTVKQICEKGSAHDERDVDEPEKKEVYQNYGIARCEGWCSGPQGCEIDRLISLELGGANVEDNLWPEPYDGEWSAHDKDRLENKLHQMICKKEITLKEAQRAISTDWVAAYKKYVGALKPFKPTRHCPT